MKDEVLPLPLVPAMWIGFKVSKSAGYFVLVRVLITNQDNSHLIASLFDPFYHLRYGILVHALAGFPYRIDNRKIALQRVERRYGGIVVARHAAVSRNVLIQGQSCTGKSVRH